MDIRVLIAAAVLAVSAPALADNAAFSTLETPQNEANTTAGPRTVPGHAIPVPAEPDLSNAAQALVAAPYRVPASNANPPNAEGFSHAQYLFDAAAPETVETFGEIATFFDQYLAT